MTSLGVICENLLPLRVPGRLTQRALRTIARLRTLACCRRKPRESLVPSFAPLWEPRYLGVAVVTNRMWRQT